MPLCAKTGYDTFQQDTQILFCAQQKWPGGFVSGRLQFESPAWGSGEAHSSFPEHLDKMPLS